MAANCMHKIKTKDYRKMKKSYNCGDSWYMGKKFEELKNHACI